VFSPCKFATIWSVGCKYVNANIVCDSDSWVKDPGPFFLRRLVDVTGTVGNRRRFKICFLSKKRALFRDPMNVLSESFISKVQNIIHCLLHMLCF